MLILCFRWFHHRNFLFFQKIKFTIIFFMKWDKLFLSISRECSKIEEGGPPSSRLVGQDIVWRLADVAEKNRQKTIQIIFQMFDHISEDSKHLKMIQKINWINFDKVTKSKENDNNLMKIDWYNLKTFQVYHRYSIFVFDKEPYRCCS